MNPVYISFPSPEILTYLHGHYDVDAADYGWIIGAAFCVIENAHSHDDAYLELHQYLVHRLPGYNNDKICQHAASYGHVYTAALYEVADDYATAIMGVAECICPAFDRMGINHLLTQGYSITKVKFIMDMVSTQWLDTTADGPYGQREWLFEQLDHVLGDITCS